MTNFELAIAIAIGVMVGTIIGSVIQFLIIDKIINTKRKRTNELWEEALKEKFEKLEKEQKEVDNNPFE